MLPERRMLPAEPARPVAHTRLLRGNPTRLPDDRRSVRSRRERFFLLRTAACGVSVALLPAAVIAVERG